MSERLLFCNAPEKIRAAGVYAEARLPAGEPSKIFYHFHNVSGVRGDFAIGLFGENGAPFSAAIQQGSADPTVDPPRAGRQAMVRFLRNPTRPFTAPLGKARFSGELGNHQIASGMLCVTPDRDARLRIYFKHDRWTVRGSRVTALDGSVCDIEVPLYDGARQKTVRIGLDQYHSRNVHDGAYGVTYAFKIDGPPGRRLRILFEPRGGQSGLVGLLNGNLVASEIQPTSRKTVLAETRIGPDGIATLKTAPFGGVSYPVEVSFVLF